MEATTKTQWLRVSPYGEAAYTYWFNGIYKIVSYRPRSFIAYYLRDGAENWGYLVSQPPAKDKEGLACWPTLLAAQAACWQHQKGHEPSSRTIVRANEIVLAQKRLQAENGGAE